MQRVRFHAPWAVATALLTILAIRSALADRPPPQLQGPPGPRPAFPAKALAPASAEFSSAWRDGKAELTGYRAVVPRYGELREGELVLVYVTEPLDRRTWIKDDDVAAPHRVDVLKLNSSLKFLTGVYPYSVMTSVFAPTDAWGGERFSPVKLSLTAQEWCGHIFTAVWPGQPGALVHGLSYFSSEGEGDAVVATPAGALYEDALLIQLRELDGPFAGGGDWSGSLVPSLWRTRRAHVPLAATSASITRSTRGDGADAVTRFVLQAGEYRRTFDVERAAPRRVLGWTTSDGEDVRLVRTARLSYWTLNGPGDEVQRELFGLPTPPARPLAPPEGTTAVGR